MKMKLTAFRTASVLAKVPSLTAAQGINAPLAQPSPTMATGSPPSPIVNTPTGAEVGVGGTGSYEQLSGAGGGGIMRPNSNGTSTIMSPAAPRRRCRSRPEPARSPRGAGRLRSKH